MKKTILFAIATLCIQSLLATELEIDHQHLNEISGDPDSIFKPIKISEEEIDPAMNRVGARKRVVITYSKVTQSEIDSTFTVSPDGDATYQLYNDDINEMMRENTELVDSHIISIEYYVTNNFSLELSDTYRHYRMEGRRVGFGFNQDSRIHDVQVGGKYTIKVIDIPNFELEIGAKATAGIVHMNSTSEIDFGVGQRKDSQYNDLAGFSYGGGVLAKATLFENFFIQGGVDSRNYVMAPMEHDNGVSHQVDQNGLLFYLGVGVQF